MPGGRANITPDDNTNGFQKHPENIVKRDGKGRPISVKTMLKDLMKQDGEIKIDRRNIVRETTTHLIVKIPTLDAVAMRLLSMAMSSGSTGFQAIKLIVEYLDGKPVQPISADFSEIREAIKNVFPLPNVDGAVPERKKDTHYKRSPIIVIDFKSGTEKEYKTLKAASDATGINMHRIWRAVKAGGKQIDDYEFRYKV